MEEEIDNKDKLMRTIMSNQNLVYSNNGKYLIDFFKKSIDNKLFWKLSLEICLRTRNFLYV